VAASAVVDTRLHLAGGVLVHGGGHRVLLGWRQAPVWREGLRG
jgi:hypothetical protein